MDTVLVFREHIVVKWRVRLQKYLVLTPLVTLLNCFYAQVAEILYQNAHGSFLYSIKYSVCLPVRILLDISSNCMRTMNVGAKQML